MPFEFERVAANGVAPAVELIREFSLLVHDILCQRAAAMPMIATS
jgi:hypothetical protein